VESFLGPCLTASYPKSALYSKALALWKLASTSALRRSPHTFYLVLQAACRTTTPHPYLTLTLRPQVAIAVMITDVEYVLSSK
jgi:hypothetical protein